MIKILFICHGNICRSPMAEFLLKDMVKKLGIAEKFQIESAATSTEEIGNPVHYGTRNRLQKEGISTKGKYARQITIDDYFKFDYLIGMEEVNLKNMRRICGEDNDEKMFKLLDFSNKPRDIADPWYTGNFDLTYNDIVEGLDGFLKYLKNRNQIS